MNGMCRRSFLVLLATALPLPLGAADPWTRPPGQWSETDVQRILTDSPWSKTISITVGGGMPMRGGGRSGPGGRGGAMPDASVGGGDGGMGSRAGMGEGMGASMAPSIQFQIRWQSAKPIKLATVRSRLGAEADTSQQAREFVEREEPNYVIAVIGPPMGAPPEGGGRPGAPPREGAAAPKGDAGAQDRRGNPEQWMAGLKENTWLVWKAHEKIHPATVVLPPGQRGVLIFHFPKDHPIELEDKEVEFCMRRGPMEVKKKFKLKDMVYEGKLSL